MRKLNLAGLMILLTLSATRTSAQDASSKPHSQNKLLPPKDKDKGGNSPAVDQAVKPATDDPTYVIGPQDDLIINVWREPDISRSVPVRPDGKISLPLLNDIQASGLTPMQLGSEITTKLKKFIADPQVTIIVASVNSQRIYLVGEVGRAGAFPLVPNMTVLEALASAGGVSVFAKQAKIYVLRLENGKQTRIPFKYKEALTGQGPEQNILLFLKPGDTVVVP